MLEIEEEFDPALLGIVTGNNDNNHNQPIEHVRREASYPHGNGKDGHVEVASSLENVDHAKSAPSNASKLNGQEDHASTVGSDSIDRDGTSTGSLAGDGAEVARASEGEHEVKAIDFGEGDPLADSIDPSSSHNPPRRTPRYRLVRTRIPGSRRSRISVRKISTQPQSTTDGSVTDPNTETTLTDTDTASGPPLPPLPAFPEPLDTVAQSFGPDIAEKLQREVKENVGSGVPLPRSFRDVFEALDDMNTAITIANNLRQHLGLNRIDARVGKKGKERIKMIRQIAKMREKMYLDLYVALLLPHAPVIKQQDGDTEDDTAVDGVKAKTEKDIILTPSNLEILSKSIPKSFQGEKKALKGFMPAAMGEVGGKVVWQNGVGRVVGAEGGFRGKVQEGDVHVFIDHSNILYGLLHHLYSSHSDSLPPKHLRTLSLPSLALLLRRGRPTPPGTLHLVASSPLMQSLDPAVRLGFEVSVMKRVEIYSDEVEDPNAMTLQPKPTERVGTGPGDISSTSTGLRRYKEQGVDEILHLKILQTLNGYGGGKEGGEPATIVLATGDARGGQFNRDGFVGAVREALRRGWNVELWSWSEGLSRTWKEVCRREKWGQAFGIHVLDGWAEQLVEVQRWE